VKPFLPVLLLLFAFHPGAALPLTLTLEGGGGYDDNVLRLSRSDLSRFARDPSFQPRLGSSGSTRFTGKFGLKSWWRPARGWKNTWQLAARANFYPQVPRKNYQGLGGAVQLEKRRLGVLELRYDRLFSFYLRDYRSPLSGREAPAVFDQNDWNLSLASKGHTLGFRLLAGLREEFYAADFTNYDMREYSGGLEMTFPWKKQGHLKMRYLRRHRDNLGYTGSPAPFDPETEGGDATAEEDDYRLLVYWKRPLSGIKSVSFTWQWRERFYLTGLSPDRDPIHSGRRDRRQSLRLTLNIPLPTGITFLPGLQHEWRRTRGAWPRLAERKNFRQTRIWFTLRRRFTL
jgi:hypothetical protein